MEKAWVLRGVGERVIRLTRLGPGGRADEPVGPLMTVCEVCRRLRRSRRQVYRYVRAGRLKPVIRVLGQWLFTEADVEQFPRRGVPRFLKPLFWDVALADLGADHHSDWILSRILEYGDRAAVQWALRTYSRDRLQGFLRGRGADLLSRRAWQFWALQFGVRRWRRSWRYRGRHWGGI